MNIFHKRQSIIELINNQYKFNLFNIKSAYAEVSASASSAILWDPIVSIEPVGREQVYDIEVEGTHNFIGNGIFAHNTYVLDRSSPNSSSASSLGQNGQRLTRLATGLLVATILGMGGVGARQLSGRTVVKPVQPAVQLPAPRLRAVSEAEQRALNDRLLRIFSENPDHTLYFAGYLPAPGPGLVIVLKASPSALRDSEQNYQIFMIQPDASIALQGVSRVARATWGAPDQFSVPGEEATRDIVLTIPHPDTGMNAEFLARPALPLFAGGESNALVMQAVFPSGPAAQSLGKTFRFGSWKANLLVASLGFAAGGLMAGLARSHIFPETNQYLQPLQPVLETEDQKIAGIVIRFLNTTADGIEAGRIRAVEGLNVPKFWTTVQGVNDTQAYRAAELYVAGYNSYMSRFAPGQELSRSVMFRGIAEIIGERTGAQAAEMPALARSLGESAKSDLRESVGKVISAITSEVLVPSEMGSAPRGQTQRFQELRGVVHPDVAGKVTRLANELDTKPLSQQESDALSDAIVASAARDTSPFHKTALRAIANQFNLQIPQLSKETGTARSLGSFQLGRAAGILFAGIVALACEGCTQLFVHRQPEREPAVGQQSPEDEISEWLTKLETGKLGGYGPVARTAEMIAEHYKILSPGLKDRSLHFLLNTLSREDRPRQNGIEVPSALRALAQIADFVVPERREEVAGWVAGQTQSRNAGVQEAAIQAARVYFPLMSAENKREAFKNIVRSAGSPYEPVRKAAVRALDELPISETDLEETLQDLWDQFEHPEPLLREENSAAALWQSLGFEDYAANARASVGEALDAIFARLPRVMQSQAVRYLRRQFSPARHARAARGRHQNTGASFNSCAVPTQN
ncbi:MAG: hypothetical protein HY586_00175 [Candidatus Omnitrophica bacterium]|nr:hypothetical protein [Candidatus Omnitrophota bacterium]